MRYGLSEPTIAKISGVFAAHPSVAKAVLYGSRAKGTHKSGSDIDLTLHGDALTPKELGVIAEELDDLLLPYQIDLSLFSRIEHAPLREHIERVGVVFYRREAEGEPDGSAGSRGAGRGNGGDGAEHAERPSRFGNPPR